MNSEIWNEGQSDEGGLTRADILPHVSWRAGWECVCGGVVLDWVGVVYCHSAMGTRQTADMYTRPLSVLVLMVLTELSVCCEHDVMYM